VIAVGLAFAGISAYGTAPEARASTTYYQPNSEAHLSVALPSDPQGNVPAKLDALGSDHYAALYGGLVEVSNGRHVNVYLTNLRASVEAAFRDEAAPGDLTFFKTPHSLQYVDAINQRVIAASLQLIRRGVKLVEWGPQIQSGRETIGVMNLTSREAALLSRMFGASNVSVFNVPRNGVPVLTSTSRDYDSSPWKGGDYITNYSFGCTAAFGVTIGGHERLLTAAHCFRTSGDIIDNQDLISGKGSGDFIGYVGTILTASSDTDAEVINASSTGKVYTGGPYSSTLTNISGTATNPVGGTVWNDGAYSGETIKLSISANNECIIVSGFREVCHVDQAYTPLTGEVANQDGDSGGPMIRVISGHTYAAGIVSASTSDEQTPCQYNTPDTCYLDVFYSDIGSVLSELKATIIKG
jgi:hypothetical protein